MPAPVYIVEAARTPIGRIRGALCTIRPDDLLALAFKAVLERSGLEGAQVDEAIAGCANQAGEDNRNVARMAVLLAGLPQTVPAVTVNRLCASGLSAVNQAARQIACGEAQIMLAGGVESMSRAPLVVAKGPTGFPSGNRTLFDSALGWRFPNPKLEARIPLEAMGETAENLAEQYEISRQDQDAFAYRSHRRALDAQAEGRFDAETIPVPVPQRKSDPIVVTADEGPRANTSLERLAQLKPAFREGGTVTAGNSSTLNDGAACVLLASEDAVEKHGLRPLARWCGAQAAGVDPRIMGIGPVPATQKLLGRLGLELADLDLVELNEAFSAQALAVLRGLGCPDGFEARVNVNGGAIALGHPLGASGARILTTLVHEMQRRGAQRGLATLCVGVGQGEATVVEAVPR